MPTKEYKKYIGLKSLFYFCSLPIRLDSYRGCSLGCLYCFSQKLNNRRFEFNNCVLPANPNRFSKLMESVLDLNDCKGLIRSCIIRRLPIHFGCVSDPFQKAEVKNRVTYEFLKVFKKYNYPFVLSTKSDLVISDEYLNLIKTNPCSIQISFSTFDDKLAEKIEPNAPPPSKRLNVLEALSENGIYTVARIQPYLYGIDKISEKNFKRIAKTGAKHIILEHLRIPTNSSLKIRKKLWNAIGINLLEEYEKEGIQNSRVNYEIASDIKYNNVVKAKRIANSYGMTFGAGDNDFHHFSDKICCCGIPDNEHFQNIYKGHLGFGIFNAMKDGKLSFDYINKAWHPVGSIKEFVNSDCRIKGKNDIISFLNSKIRNPKSSNSPEKFYGVKYKFGTHYIIKCEITEK